MIYKNVLKILMVTALFITSSVLIGCSSDDGPSPSFTVSVNSTVLTEDGILFDDGGDFNGDVDGDFTGNGGSGSRTFLWRNNLTTADYNADITATSEGNFNIIVADADGTVVLNSSLSGASEPDSIDGVTDSGVSGIWSVTITVENFNGDGSFSLSEGN